MLSSSLAPGSDNLNTIYLYNSIRGQLKNIPGLVNETILVKVYSGSVSAPTTNSVLLLDEDNNALNHVTGGQVIEGGVALVGVYSASFATTASGDYLYDVWFTASQPGNITQFFTGSYEPTSLSALELIYEDEYVTDVTNLRGSYTKGQKPRLRVFARKKNWNPNIYTSATTKVVPEVIDDGYYRLTREIDNMEIIPFGTGSGVKNYTRMSYDVSGNYFELDTAHLEPGFTYKLQFAYYLQGQYRQQSEEFKFRVEEPAP